MKKNEKLNSVMLNTKNRDVQESPLNSLKALIEKFKRRIDERENVKVRICFLGKTGSGKSSLINALIGKKVAKEGLHTDTTTKADKYHWKDNDIKLVDLPGYDTEKFPKEDFTDKFKLAKYDATICVFNDKFTLADSLMFKEAIIYSKAIIFVRSQSDNIFQEGKSDKKCYKEIEDDFNKKISISHKPVFVSVRNKQGLDELQMQIFNALPKIKAERYIRFAKSYGKKQLDKKLEACIDFVVDYAAYSFANGALNSFVIIPGTDIPGDVAIMNKMYIKIRQSFGLDEEILKEYAVEFSIAGSILKTLTTEGIKKLLIKSASKVVIKNVGKYIPFVGPLIAGSMGFALTKYAGKKYAQECYELALCIFESEINKAKANF